MAQAQRRAGNIFTAKHWSLGGGVQHCRGRAADLDFWTNDQGNRELHFWTVATCAALIPVWPLPMERLLLFPEWPCWPAGWPAAAPFWLNGQVAVGAASATGTLAAH